MDQVAATHDPAGAGRPLRVANIIEEGRWAGPQKRICDIASLLQKQGIVTTVILPAQDNQVFVEKLQALGVPYRIVPMTRLSRHWTGLAKFALSFPFDVWRLRRALKAVDADVVHCNSAGQWKGVIASRLLNRPALWHLNDTNMPGAVRLVFARVGRYASGFIAAGERVATYYLATDFAKSTRFLVQAPVDCEAFNRDRIAPDADIAGKPGLKVGSVGNVNAAKGIVAFVEMAHLLRQSQGDSLRCMQVGAQFETQKDFIAELNALNRKHGAEVADLLGARKDVRSFLRALDIYVCSSHFEASPINIWEAMAMGLPIVTTDVGDLARMNADGDFARVVPVGDHQALAQAVSALAADPAERQRLGANARRYASANLDVSICAARHAAAYRATARVPVAVAAPAAV
jgi:glycosyltransferase involved in cell wall biosynthesis